MENENKKKPKKKFSWKKFGINASIFLGVAIVGLGAGLGIGYLVAQNKEKQIQYVTGDKYAITAEYLDEALATYKGAKSRGTSYEKALTPDQMVNVAFHLYGQHQTCKATGVGYSDAGITKQEIQTTAIKNGDKYFEESNSLGLINLYDRMYQEGEETVKYWGGDSSYENHKPETLANSEYADQMGKKVSDPLIFLISPKTISTEEDLSGEGVSAAYKEDGGYRVEIELGFISDSNGNKTMPGVGRYLKQMKTISELASYPTFYYCHITFLMDEELNIKKSSTQEYYEVTKASIPVPSKCKGHLVNVYETDGDFKIPELTDKIEYPASLD